MDILYVAKLLSIFFLGLSEFWCELVEWYGYGSGRLLGELKFHATISIVSVKEWMAVAMSLSDLKRVFKFIFLLMIEIYSNLLYH